MWQRRNHAQASLCSIRLSFERNADSPTIEFDSKGHTVTASCSFGDELRPVRNWSIRSGAGLALSDATTITGSRAAARDGFERGWCARPASSTN